MGESARAWRWAKRAADRSGKTGVSLKRDRKVRREANSDTPAGEWNGKNVLRGSIGFFSSAFATM